ncbi:unnamed protein product [Mytilus coruscus]|uniref:Uncharacterized protein n=1 Tax=Mytilus coruscus TaxID=42192 RepID=A0A6J8DNQ2_MYTCO|nr:unnamed protein product [Mytilus coruscus]
MSFFKNIFSPKPEISASSPTASKSSRLNGILRKESTSDSSSLDNCDSRCSSCTETQSVYISNCENSSDDSDSCIDCGSKLGKNNSKINPKRVSFNAQVKRRVFLSDASERARDRTNQTAVRHSIHVNPQYHKHSIHVKPNHHRHSLQTSGYVMYVPGHLGSSYQVTNKGTVYFRII